MATHNSLFAETDVHRHPEGISVSLQLPWYRSLWLSAVDNVTAKVDGRDIPTEQLRFELQGRSYRVDELKEQWDTLWFLQDRPDVVIPLDRVPSAGDRVDVEVVPPFGCCTCRSRRSGTSATASRSSARSCSSSPRSRRLLSGSLLRRAARCGCGRVSGMTQDHKQRLHDHRTCRGGTTTPPRTRTCG